MSPSRSTKFDIVPFDDEYFIDFDIRKSNCVYQMLHSVTDQTKIKHFLVKHLPLQKIHRF